MTHSYMLHEDILSRFFYIGVGEHGFIIPSPSPGYRLARFAYQYFSCLTPLFAFFFPTTKPGPRLTLGQNVKNKTIVT